MNKVKLLFALLTLIIVISILITNTIISKSKHTLLYSFTIISDTHLGVNESKNSRKIAISKITLALNCIKYCFPNDKCIVINGDVVDNYYNSSYSDLTNAIINANSSSRKIPYIYFNLGNHEFKANGEGPSILQYYTRSLHQFFNKTSYIQKQLTPSKDISHSYRDTNKSYDLQHVCSTPFFFLGSDNIKYGYSNDCAYLKPDSQLAYLNNHIDNKLSFIFCHQPPYNTVKGSDISNCISNTNDLLSILKKHSNAIMFTAHTHRNFESYPLTLGNNYSKLGSCPVITSPSVYRSLEGLHVSVYSDFVYIQGIKYSSNTSYITNPSWALIINR